MDPIVYRKDAFPIELSRSRSYVDFSAGWSVDMCKFCVREGRSFGWRYDVTTRGAYDTFAEAYAAAEQTARELAAEREENNNICLLDREDNKKKLVGSWGLSRAQSEELTRKPSLEDTLHSAAARQAEGAKAPAQTKGEKGRS